MREPGEVAYAKRREDRTAVYSFERARPSTPMQRRPSARIAGGTDVLGGAAARLPPPRDVLGLSAKRPETRAKRLAALVDGCARGERLARITGTARDAEVVAGASRRR